MREKTITPTRTATDAPRPIDVYGRWLAEVDHIVRQAFHSDRRITEDAQHVTRGRAARAAIVDTKPAHRFAAILAASRAPIDADCLAAAETLAARRRAVRDALAVIAGMQEDEGWDALYQRVTRATLHALGCELHRLGAIKHMPAYDPYRRRMANTAMSTAPSDAEDVLA